MTVRDMSVSSVEPYEGGVDFGGAGPYELVKGTVRVTLDPGDPANARIVDLASAPRDAEVTADVVLLRPADPRRSNGSLLYTVANRGDVSIQLGLDMPPRDLSGALPPGDGFLLRDGWTLAWSGWQFDVERGPGRVGIDVPQAVRDGSPIGGRARARITPLIPSRSHPLADWTATLLGTPDPVYPATDPSDRDDAVLTVAEAPDGPWRVVEGWRFARDVRGVAVPDPGHVWLDDGFEPGMLYEVVYPTARCPIVGAGLAAVRDVVSYLREREGSDRVVAFGRSQAGRFLRQFLHEGLNVDEHGRTVFDGVLCHIAGARRGEFNHRYAMPAEALAPGFADLPPFGAGALLERQRRTGGVPKLIEVNGSWEYWRGDAALGHIAPDGSADLPEPPDARTYLIASSDHVGHAPGSAQLWGAANRENGLDHTPALRGLLVALHAWLSGGTPPPPSRVPRIADGTAVTREEVLRRVAGVPGLTRPTSLPIPRRLDLGPAADQGVGTYPPVRGEAYPCLVADVDDDGNETCGVTLPENAVPIATRTGWNTAAFGALAPMVGSRVPFPLEPDPDDPRTAINERYADRDDYELRLKSAADELVRERFLLPEDVAYVITRALRRYDTARRPRKI